MAAPHRLALPRLALPLLLLLLLGTARPASTGGGDIVIGQTAAFTGSEGEYGRRLSRGLRLALDEANGAGGVRGRNLTLVALDDAHNVTRAADNARQLLTAYNATLLANVYGTDSLQAILALAVVARRPVPIVGPYTGVAMARFPFNEQIVNVRASTVDEINALATFVTETLLLRRVGYLSSRSASGNASLLALRQALQYAGVLLVSYAQIPQFNLNMTAAVEAVVGGQARPQALVFAMVEAQTLAFLAAYRQHPLADPNCLFLTISTSLTPTFTQRLDPAVWPYLHMSLAVPLPGDPATPIAQRVTALCQAQGETADPLVLEGYITGRLIVEVFRDLRDDNFTGAAFLDQLYSSRLFTLDGLTLGPFSRDFPGCETSLCACSTGLRPTFLAGVNASGVLMPSLAALAHSSFNYPISQCSSTVADQVHPPLAFVQLVPQNDPLGRAVALQIAAGMQTAMAEANAAATFGKRQFKLLPVEYGDDPLAALQATADRFLFIVSLGSVVPDALALRSIISTVATYETTLRPQEDGFAVADLRVQPSTPLELMALASFAPQLCGTAVHLRAPQTAAGAALLQLMVQSAHTLQYAPASAETYAAAETPFGGIAEGCVCLAAGAAEVQRWYGALGGRPNVYLLTLSSVAAHVAAMNSTAVSPVAADHLLFPSLYGGLHDSTTRNGTASDSWLYGYMAVQLVSQALLRSTAPHAYTTPPDLLDAWYLTKMLGLDDVSFGPYSDAACTTASSIAAGCECNNGARTLILRSVASRNLGHAYTTTSCQVQYQPLRTPPDTTWVLITGVSIGVGGAPVVLGLLWWAATRGRRNNRNAPKDPWKPFCILFTDIQASTHLWATLPSRMVTALDMHHSIIRQQIAQHRCYEVKTIGDSFMVAVQSPERAVALALSIQMRLFEHDWGTEDIDDTYKVQSPEEVSLGEHCWNGLRVRIGVHLGHGDIALDPVTHGYDYYGTVVNTAARIESVCHGGQVAVSQAVYDALSSSFPNAVWQDLGPQLLRGLAEPIHLWQVLPEGPLAKRRFPPLRVVRAHSVAETEGERAPTSARHPGKASSVVPALPGAASHGSPDPAPAGHRASPTRVLQGRDHSLPSTAGSMSDSWVDTHPLVENGTVAGEELRRHHFVALTTLSAVLATQTEKFKELVLRGLCERLHVPYVGSDGVLLERSLHGIVLRVLPSVVASLPFSAGREGTFGELRRRQLSTVIPDPLPILDAGDLPGRQDEL